MSRRRDPAAALRLPQAIATDVGQMARRDLGPIRRIAEVWPASVGELLAAKARPARLSGDGTLVVHATDASWAHAIQLEGRTILRRLADALGAEAPKALKVEIGPVDAAPELPPEPIVAAPSAEALRRADEMTREVADPRLREALQRAIARSLSARKTP